VGIGSSVGSLGQYVYATDNSGQVYVFNPDLTLNTVLMSSGVGVATPRVNVPFFKEELPIELLTEDSYNT